MHFPAFGVDPGSASFPPSSKKGKRIPVLHAVSWFADLAFLATRSMCVRVLHSLSVWSKRHARWTRT